MAARLEMGEGEAAAIYFAHAGVSSYLLRLGRYMRRHHSAAGSFRFILFRSFFFSFLTRVVRCVGALLGFTVPSGTSFGFQGVFFLVVICPLYFSLSLPLSGLF